MGAGHFLAVLFFGFPFIEIGTGNTVMYGWRIFDSPVQKEHYPLAEWLMLISFTMAVVGGSLLKFGANRRLIKLWFWLFSAVVLILLVGSACAFQCVHDPGAWNAWRNLLIINLILAAIPLSIIIYYVVSSHRSKQARDK